MNWGKCALSKVNLEGSNNPTFDQANNLFREWSCFSVNKPSKLSIHEMNGKLQKIFELSMFCTKLLISHEFNFH